MMAFGFREFTNLLNKGKRLAEIAKPKAPLDAVSFLRQLPVRGLCVKELSLLARKRRYSPATGSTGFASKSFGHVACPSCQPSPDWRSGWCIAWRDAPYPLAAAPAGAQRSVNLADRIERVVFCRRVGVARRLRVRSLSSVEMMVRR